ncbi:P-loop containing nucleoside triphosphate hydrolase protein [Calocera viscosa TUFC12733]|uniref:p-loop containing nucleoside triphosphate hydrolase protein n=1 Tax=Calocera viscosa (strain TUFC12733) TaxID=1330018 RepID=A0A167G4L4_CALVF|nr:P-loop containing nucleoside triphosphate hydrolase protein [Calocera viscosa TUFC12733]
MDSCSRGETWWEPRLVPCYAAALSAVFLIVWATRRGTKHRPIRGDSNASLDGGSGDHLLDTKLRRHVQHKGGKVVYTFHVLRLLCAATLAILASARFLLDSNHVDDTGLTMAADCQLRIDLLGVISYSYAAVLSLAAIVVQQNITKVFTYNAGIVLLIQCCVFSWRNFWPLMIFGGVPADSRYPGLTWTEGGFLVLAGVIIPLVIPEPYVPVDPQRPSKPPPEQTASLAAINFFYFLEPFMYKSFCEKIAQHEAIPVLADYDQAAILEMQGEKILDPWQRRELGLKDRHLLYGLMEFFGGQVWLQVFIVIVNVIATFLGPIAINRLLQYLETGGKDALVRPWYVAWIVLIFISRMLFSLGENGYLYVVNAMAVQAESLLLQLIFAQSMRMRISSPTSKDSAPPSSAASATGQPDSDDGEAKKCTSVINVNTLIGADVPTILEAKELVFFFLQLPLEVIASVWFLTAVLGWSAVIGMIFLVATVPLPGLFTKQMGDTQKMQMEKTDQRVKTMTESLNILRMIKMFAWESMVRERVQDRRAEELLYTRRRRFLELIVGNLTVLLPMASMIITYGTYARCAHINTLILASVVFSSMSIFDLLRMDLVAITGDLNSMINAKISLDRVDNFLRKVKLSQRDFVLPHDDLDHGNVVGFHNASFAWDPKADGSNSRNFRLSFEGDIIFTWGGINLIIGPTGCGKTSVLMALLGEMHFQPTSPYGWYSLPRHAGIAYAVQESWVMNATIKDNILFGSAYEEDRYSSVLQQCALEPDLALFAAGDETEVGEKGITLSGGQKARITLARAIYSNAGILLLDDILSALDVHTSRWIVEKCLQGELVQGRTVILVTHALPLVGPIANSITELDINGRIKRHGPPARQLMDSAKRVQDDSNEERPQNGHEIHDALDEKPDGKMADGKLADGKLVADEELAQGRLKWAAIELLLSSYGGVAFWLLLVVVFFSSQLTDIMITWWLGAWTSAYETQSKGVPAAYYLAIFIVFSLSQTALSTIGNVTYIYRSIGACRRVHEILMESVMSSTLRWIDTTPRGRIISRFTQDIRDVDGPLTKYFVIFITRSILLLLKFSAVMVGSPILLLPGLLVAIVGFSLGQVYLYVQMGVKRIHSNWKSPIYNHFSAAIAGLVSIRAYGAQEEFKLELFRRLDAYSAPSRCFQNLHRWVASRVDTLGAVFATGVAAYLVYFKSEQEAGRTGLNMAIGFAGMILWWLRTANSMEITANSLERIRDYLEIDHEAKPSEAGKPPAYWPASGSIRVENMSAKYSEDSPLVLQDVTFDVKSGERVGIVGRTGSGKSTLALSLLRLIPTSGEVYFDGLPTSSLNLDSLRGNLTIIPQEPVLVSGTLRTNLDPFDQEDDAVLNDALRATRLLDRGENNMSLDTMVSDAGGNFSVGERQLIALARALIRNTRVLLLDEATASVDHETDNIIQESIRRELNGATLMTIAHRLRTIMDYDKIMVLDAGKLIEFDTPVALLDKKDSLFKSLVEESGDRDELKTIARQRVVSGS